MVEVSLKKYFTDIHSHILPGFDDGASNLESSLMIARAACEGRVARIIATPHVNLEASPPDLDLLPEGVKLLNDAFQAHGLPLRAYPGAEVRINTTLLEEGRNQVNLRRLTLNHAGKYLLTDLPPSNIPLPTDEIFFQLQLSGITPILAHPERNGSFHQHPESLARLIERGVKIQVNTGSLLGHYGKRVKRFCWSLLREDLAHLVASDAHNFAGKRLDFPLIYRMLSSQLGKVRAQRLIDANPWNVLMGAPLEEPNMRGDPGGDSERIR
jgi:protein-tyrosine phosphatase